MINSYIKIVLVFNTSRPEINYSCFQYSISNRIFGTCFVFIFMFTLSSVHFNDPLLHLFSSRLSSGLCVGGCGIFHFQCKIISISENIPFLVIYLHVNIIYGVILTNFSNAAIVPRIIKNSFNVIFNFY